MSEPDTSTTAETAEATPAEPSSTPMAKTGFGSLARTIRRRTWDLIAIGILLVAGLTFGTRLSNWWDRDAEPPPIPDTAFGSTWNVDAPGQPIEMLFGDSDLVIHRERVSGDVSSAVRRLVLTAGEIAATAPLPTDAISESERRLLRATEKLQAVVRPSEFSSVYFSPLPVPSVVAVRRPDGDAVSHSPRVVCWGLALGNESTWTLFVFEPRPTSEADGVGVETISVVALPPSARRTVSIRGRNGEGMIGFEGRADDDDRWRAFFDETLTAGVGRRTAGWQRTAGVRAARYEVVQDERRFVIDVQYEDGEDLMRGWIAVHEANSPIEQPDEDRR